MKKWLGMAVAVSIIVLMTSCGGSEQVCMEQCVKLFAQKDNQCMDKNKMNSLDEVECKLVAARENSRCTNNCLAD